MTFFYAVYYIKLTNSEIEKVENENLIDDDEKFEAFCLQSKSKEIVALFANKFQAELFSESITSTILARFRYAKIVKVSDPICIIKKIKKNSVNPLTIVRIYAIITVYLK